MKNKILLFTVMTCLISQAYGQRHELSAGAGILSRPFIKENRPFTKKYNGSSDNDQHFGAFQLNYRYKVCQYYSIGLSVVYEQQKHDISSGYPGMENKHHIYTDHYFSLMVSNRYAWMQTRWVNLSSSLDLGACLPGRDNSADYENEFTRTRFAYQITPFSIRVGKRWGGYAEIGYGYKGILSAGFSYRF